MQVLQVDEADIGRVEPGKKATFHRAGVPTTTIFRHGQNRCETIPR